MFSHLETKDSDLVFCWFPAVCYSLARHQSKRVWANLASFEKRIPESWRLKRFVGVPVGGFERPLARVSFPWAPSQPLGRCAPLKPHLPVTEVRVLCCLAPVYLRSSAAQIAPFDSRSSEIASLKAATGNNGLKPTASLRFKRC